MEEKRNRTSRDTDRAGARAGSEQTHRQPGSAQREGAYRYRNPEEEGYYGNGQGQQHRQGQGGYYQNGPQQGYYQNGPQQGYYQNGPQQGYYPERAQQATTQK